MACVSVQSMYEHCTTVVRVNGRYSKAFGVTVGVHQGLFIIVLETLSKEFMPTSGCCTLMIKF